MTSRRALVIAAPALLLPRRSRSQVAFFTKFSGGVGWVDQTNNTPNQEGPLFVALDSTGVRLFIGGNPGPSPVGRPALSSNEGATFVSIDTSFTARAGGFGVSSSDGQILAYVVTEADGMTVDIVRVSSNMGSSWSATTVTGSNPLLAISMSGSGVKIIIGTNNAGGSVYISTDAGTSYAPKAAFGTANWTDVKYSRNGSTVYAAGISGPSIGSLMRSTNDGISASDVTPSATAVVRVCCSSDGSYIVASDQDGHIWTSNNSGGSWTDRGLGPDSFVGAAGSLSCSDDGQVVLFGSGSNAHAFKSTDGGVTWVSATPTSAGNPFCAVSADGSKLAFSDAGNTLWVFS